MTGLFKSEAVSRTALIEFEPVTFTAGSANFFSFANSKIF